VKLTRHLGDYYQVTDYNGTVGQARSVATTKRIKQTNKLATGKKNMLEQS